MKIWWRLRFWNNPTVSNYPGHLVKETGVRILTVLHNHDNRESPFHDKHGVNRDLDKKHWFVPYHLTQSSMGAGTLNLGDSVFLYTGNHCYTGKLCHRGKCHSGNCHSGERWMSRPFVHSGNLNFKHTLTNDLVFHNAWKRIICHFITERRTCCWRDHSQCCLCLHLIFICHRVHKASSSTSPHYGNSHSGNCHCFTRWHNFPVYMAIHWSLTPLFEVDYRSSWNKGIEKAYYTATETIQNITVLEP